VASLDARKTAAAAGDLGKHDLSFDLGEPERYRKYVPKAEVRVLDAGHFALDTDADQIAQLVRGFMK
jgi:pimeloyl-ACP methyl ester carboxylesterase